MNARFLRMLMLFIFLALSAPVVEAELGEIPENTFLWTQFDQLMVKDSFLVGTSKLGIVVCLLEDSIYTQVNQMQLDFNPVSMKQFDDVLTIKTATDDLLLLNLASLPEIEILGQIDLNLVYADHVLRGTNLYLAALFKGLWRFEIDASYSARFVDSSMKGIVVTQVDVINDTMYVLDEYNGILRYGVASDGALDYIDYMGVPFRAVSFLKIDSIFAIPLQTGGVLFGQFGGNGIIDSIGGIPKPNGVYQTDTLLILANDRSLELINKNNRNETSSITIEAKSAHGAVTRINNRYNLTLPQVISGFAFYDLTDSTGVRSGLRRSGPVRDLLLHKGVLYIGGDDGPVDIYRFDDDSQPLFDTVINPVFTGVAGMEGLDDNLFVLYNQRELGHGIVVYSGLAENHLFCPCINGSVEADPFDDPRLVISESMFNDTLRLMYVKKNRSIDIYRIRLNELGVWEMAMIGTQTFISGSRIQGFADDGRRIYVKTKKEFLEIFGVTKRLELERLSVISMSFPTTEMILVNHQLILFGDSQMMLIDVSNPNEPVIGKKLNLDVAISKSVRRGDRLYTVGPDQVALFDLSTGLPVLIEAGGLGGSFLSVNDSLMIVSDGFSVDVYRTDDITTSVLSLEESLPTGFNLKQNSPNPFNFSTIIAYSLDRSSLVELTVFNLLGQEVGMLVDERQAAGQYRVEWNGHSLEGQPLSSGVYLYRLRTDEAEVTRKMVLLK